MALFSLHQSSLNIIMMKTATKNVKPDEEKEEQLYPDEPPSRDKRPDYNPSEMVIKEMMHQNEISYEEALHLLRNPAE